MNRSRSVSVDFPGSTDPAPSLQGGKGAELARWAAAGLPVPPGTILTTRFFAPWLELLSVHPAWAKLASAPLDELSTHCADLERSSRTLPLSAEQATALDAASARCVTLGGLVAVRSSSPEEDLSSASFAGAYRTLLGVSAADLEPAIRECFASSFDTVVVAYRRASGFDAAPSAFALIVQQQLDSERAGVAFSIDPTTNDYDHVVVESTWGQGEAVVAGRVEPDRDTVDKIARTIVSRHVGSKEVELRLDPAGGLREQPPTHARQSCLLPEDALEIAALAARVEAASGRPVDIEWAYADGRLHLLQVRPITAYVPLPPEMVTEPGTRRRLYGDIALSSGLTINGAISPLGLDWMSSCVRVLARAFGVEPASRPPTSRPTTPDAADALWFNAGGRMYQNLSNVLRLVGPRRLAEATEPSDALMAATLAAVDADRYRAPRRPSWLRWTALGHLPRVVRALTPPLGRFVGAMARPERAARRLEHDLERHRREIDQLAARRPSLEALRSEPLDRHMRRVVGTTMPALGAGLSAVSALQRLAVRRSLEPPVVEALGLGFVGNVVAEMGIDLSRLARRLHREVPEARSSTAAELADSLRHRELPADVLAAWDAFMARYGWRGPSEMDLASPRAVDRPDLLLDQLLALPTDAPRLDPEAAHRRRVAERRRAVELLWMRCGPLERRLVEHLTRVVEAFAGHRDTPKHANLLYFQLVRDRVLAVGDALVADGRLDARSDVFGLTFADLDAARLDPSLDLRALRHRRTVFHRRLDEANVRAFPAVIDSRGRILRPPRGPERPGELHGTAISSGRARGRARVLERPDEKALHPGDILVAYTTDPGWTPLLARAGAVVLEIGGALQHGAVVAREYGKPCVAGIDRLLERLDDGQLVEVDGDLGVVRRLDDVAEPADDSTIT